MRENVDFRFAGIEEVERLGFGVEENARRLREALAEIPGLEPQPYGSHTTRHAYHLFVIRYDEAVFGVPRSVFCKAMQAEGVPLSEGYPVPLYAQPLFTNRAFGPFRVSEAMDYERVFCPNAEHACRRQGTWLWQGHLLASREEIERVGQAFEKVYQYREDLLRVGVEGS